MTYVASVSGLEIHDIWVGLGQRLFASTDGIFFRCRKCCTFNFEGLSVVDLCIL